MKADSPTAMTSHETPVASTGGFGRANRRRGCQTLLEQLQGLRRAPLRPADAAQVGAPEPENGHDEDRPKSS